MLVNGIWYFFKVLHVVPLDPTLQSTLTISETITHFKLDWVGPVDNKPSTGQLHDYILHYTKPEQDSEWDKVAIPGQDLEWDKAVITHNVSPQSTDPVPLHNEYSKLQNVKM